MRTFTLTVALANELGGTTTHEYVIQSTGVPTPNINGFITWYANGRSLGFNANQVIWWDAKETHNND